MTFGVLDGGRGLMASLFATFGLLLLSHTLISGAKSTLVLQRVILFYSAATLFAEILIRWLLPSDPTTNTHKDYTATVASAICQTQRLAAGGRSNLFIRWLQSTGQLRYLCRGDTRHEPTRSRQPNNLSQLDPSRRCYRNRALGRPLKAQRLNYIVICLCHGGLLSLKPVAQCHGSKHRSDGESINHLYRRLRPARYLLQSNRRSRRGPSCHRCCGRINFHDWLTPDIFFAAVSGRILNTNSVAVGFENYFY
jgi:hypothetical protein